MKFKDVLVDREERFSIGVEEESGHFYLSIPVSNGMVDYEEYYEIDEAAFETYRIDMKAAMNLVLRCRNREADDLLMIQPGKDRGTPV